jgi:glycosyltransferase involved in cell wall biosynthesis
LRIGILGSRGYGSSYSGYETLVRELAPYLVAAGHEVYCYERGRLPGSRTADGIRCISTLGIEGKSVSTLSYGLSSAIDAAVRRLDVALVVNIANGFWLPLLRAARVPTLVNTDGLEWLRGKWSPTAKRVFRAGARTTANHADRLVADSEEIARIWELEFGRTSTFIPYGAPLVEAPGADRLAEVGLAAAPYVLSVARLVPENNIDLLLDSVAALRERGLRTVVVGTGVGKTPLEDRIGAMAAAEEVTWLGHVHDQELLTQLWANCTAYVHGHSVGGTNPSLLQALGTGAPVVALDTPFNLEVLADRSRLYEPSAAALTARVAEVVDIPDRRQALVVAGRRIVAERYTWPGVCSSYLGELEDLARRRRAR